MVLCCILCKKVVGFDSLESSPDQMSLETRPNRILTGRRIFRVRTEARV